MDDRWRGTRSGAYSAVNANFVIAETGTEIISKFFGVRRAFCRNAGRSQRGPPASACKLKQAWPDPACLSRPHPAQLAVWAHLPRTDRESHQSAAL